ncbi:kinase-like domain-containing protein [Mycena polygramma]|nr:kinase-like domain-containing protein [Mycena polygramma]
MSATQHDLSTVTGAQAYLAPTPFASTSVVLLSGVHVNFTYRLYLEKPYKGRSTLVMKHAQPDIMLSATETLPAMERQTFEALALQKIKDHLECEATVPALHHFDEIAHVLIMDDCGVDSLNLKQLMLTAPPEPHVARAIGAALGEFLGRLHAWGAGDPALLDAFDGNKCARKITSWITYERLLATLTTDAPPAVACLRAPPSEHTLNSLRALVAQCVAQIHSACETLTMGDFWTGNVIVHLRPASASASADTSELELDTVHVIDWEVVKPGLAALDIGQFLAEIHTVSLFHPETAPSTTALTEGFLTAYRESAWSGETRGEEGKAQEVIRMARMAGMHMGAVSPFMHTFGPPFLVFVPCVAK